MGWQVDIGEGNGGCDDGDGKDDEDEKKGEEEYFSCKLRSSAALLFLKRATNSGAYTAAFSAFTTRWKENERVKKSEEQRERERR